MFPGWTFFLISHSAFRWLILISLLGSIGTACHGLVTNRSFTRRDNQLRHWTATLTHIQLMLGIILYTQSPIVQYFWKGSGGDVPMEITFFGVTHVALMVTAIVVITLGSAMAKRKASDHDKFKTVLIWFGIGLFLIAIAIPWPFSPLAARPYIRTL